MIRLALAAALTIGLLITPRAAAAQPAPPPSKATRMGFRVAGGDPAISAKLDRAIRAELAKRPGYVIVDSVRSAEFVVYANRDTNDRVNPAGVSVAIALVTNAPTYKLASKLLADGPDGTKDPEIRDQIVSMVREIGFLQRLNLIHMDADSDANIEAAAKAIVEDFAAKIPPDLGG
jgi:hypothetical protein